MGNYSDTCDGNACGNFELIVKKDGTYSVKGITLGAFNQMFPKFEVVVSPEGQISVENFYVNSAGVNKANPTQLSIGSNIVSDNVLTLNPARSSQITSWEVKYGSGITGTLVQSEGDIVADDYPTLSEVLSSLDSPEAITSLTCPLYGEYKTQISDAVNGGLLPSLTKVWIKLPTGIPDAPLLAQCTEMQGNGGFTGRVIIPDLEQTSFDPIFEITSTVTKIKLYPYYFSGEAETDICQYAQALVNAAIAYSPTRKIEFWVYDYHVPTQFNEGVISDEEPLENLLTTLLKLQNCDFSFGDTPFKFSTPYGWYESRDNAWHYSTSFHHSVEGGVEHLDGTYRPEYEAGVIATVSNIVGGMTWDGTQYEDMICHDVMSTAWAISPDNLTLTGLAPEGTEITPFSLLTLMPLSSLGNLRTYRRSFIDFWGGSRDSTITIQQEDGTEVTETFIVLDGISETGEKKYILGVHGTRQGFDHINVCSYTPDTLGDIFKAGSTITLTSSNTSNCFNSVNLALYYLEKGAAQVTFTNHLQLEITVTPDMMTTSGIGYSEELPLFPNHQTGLSVLTGGVLTITDFSTEDLPMYNTLLDTQQIAVLNIIGVSEQHAAYIIANIGKPIEIQVSSDQINPENGFYAEPTFYAVQKYGLGKNIVCIDGDFDALIPKVVGDYYHYLIANEITVLSPLEHAFAEGTIIHNLGSGYQDIVTYLKDIVTMAVDETIERFIDPENLPTFPISGGTMWLSAQFTATVEGTATHDDHEDTITRYLLEGNSIELDTIAYPPNSDICTTKANRFALASISIASDMTVTITPLSTDKVGDYKSVQTCDVDETCTLLSEGETATIALDLGTTRVIYTPTRIDEDTVKVSYIALDKDDNDVTDQFQTLSIGDKFLHKEMM